MIFSYQIFIHKQCNFHFNIPERNFISLAMDIWSFFRLKKIQKTRLTFSLFILRLTLYTIGWKRDGCTPEAPKKHEDKRKKVKSFIQQAFGETRRERCHKGETTSHFVIFSATSCLVAMFNSLCILRLRVLRELNRKKGHEIRRFKSDARWQAEKKEKAKETWRKKKFLISADAGMLNL